MSGQRSFCSPSEPGSPEADRKHLPFREVLGRYPTGVTVVSALEPGGAAVGLAVGSFVSVSQVPPLISFCADKLSRSWPRIRATGSFSVNVLAADQEHICRVFASKAEDKFASVPWTPSSHGNPVIDEVSAWLDCRIHGVIECGDHDVVIGRVLDMEIKRDVPPLVFYRSGYGSFHAGTDRRSPL